MTISSKVSELSGKGCARTFFGRVGGGSCNGASRFRNLRVELGEEGEFRRYSKGMGS